MIAYAAHTDTCTFFLDDEGICRQIVRRAAAMRGATSKEQDQISKCIGAQYVASLDAETQGGLVAMPKAGAPMLFAYVGETGRIALVRTGPVAKFETKTQGRPESGIQTKDGHACESGDHVRVPKQTRVRVPLPAPPPRSALDVTLDVDVPIESDSSLNCDVVFDDVTLDAPQTDREPDFDDQRTHRLDRAMLAPIVARDERKMVEARATPGPKQTLYMRSTPTPSVRHVTIVPPATSSSAPTLPGVEEPPRRGRGVLPARAR
jgi:hypothetical protein